MPMLITGGNILAWSLLSIILAAIISILIVRVVLGVKVSDLLTEIEEKQNAAIGVIFKDVAAVMSGFVFVFTTEGFTPVDHLLEALLWTAGGVLLTLVLMIIVGFFLLRLLAGRKHLQETPLHYLRRELIQEQNQALAHIIMAFLIVVGIAVIGQIL